MLTVLSTFGTRPKAIKMAPVVQQLNQYSAQIRKDQSDKFPEIFQGEIDHLASMSRRLRREREISFHENNVAKPVGRSLFCAQKRPSTGLAPTPSNSPKIWDAPAGSSYLVFPPNSCYNGS
jgi:hypothetical protein